MGSKKKKQIIGYQYYLGLHMIACQSGVTALRALRAGKKMLWQGNVTGNSRIRINQPSIFGGKKSGGSFVSDVDVEFGGDTQGVNDYLQNRLRPGKRVPAYRGLFGLVFRRAYVGDSGSMEAQSLLTTANPSDWYAAKAMIQCTDAPYPDMNPAHIIRYLLSSPRDGLGLPPAQLDDASFMAAADLFYTEQLGISLLWDRQSTIEELIQDVARYADAQVFQDPLDGLFKISPTRGGYDPAQLLELNPGNAVLSDFSRTGPGETFNQVTVIYTDQETNKSRQTSAADLALVDTLGGQVVSETVEYPGVSSPKLAATLAARDLKHLSLPLAKLKIEAGPEAGTLRPGGLFRFSWPDLGITDMVMRVGRISFGTLKNLKIRIEAVEDVFGYGSVTIDTDNGAGEGWTPISSTPQPISAFRLVETPYWFYEEQLGGLPDGAPADAGTVLVLAAKATATDRDYGMAAASSGAALVAEADRGAFCPWGDLAAAIDEQATTLTVAAQQDLDLVTAGEVALIDDEWVRVDAVDEAAGTLTVVRGCLDSIPAVHALGARIWCGGQSYGVADGNGDWLAGEQISVRIQPRNAQGDLEIAACTSGAVTLGQRANRPYPPGNVQINGALYPTELTDPASINVSWAHRDRLLQPDEPVGWFDAASYGPEAGVSYTLKLIDTSSGQTIDSATGITAASHALTAPTASGDYRIELQAGRSGITSTLFSHTLAVTITPPV